MKERSIMYKIYLNGEHYYTSDYYSDILTAISYIRNGVARIVRVDADGESIIRTVYR